MTVFRVTGTIGRSDLKPAAGGSQFSCERERAAAYAAQIVQRTILSGRIHSARGQNKIGFPQNSVLWGQIGGITRPLSKTSGIGRSEPAARRRNIPLSSMYIKLGGKDFAACGRRVTFPAMGKSPKDRWGRLTGISDALPRRPQAPVYGGVEGAPRHSRPARRPLERCLKIIAAALLNRRNRCFYRIKCA